MFRYPVQCFKDPTTTIGGGGQPPKQYRLVVLGGGRVGKTAVLKRFLYDDFVEKHRETVEDLYTRTFEVNGHFVQLHILDTAGDLAFPAMRRLSITNANGFLLVHSVSSADSFEYLKEILKEIKSVRGGGNGGGGGEEKGFRAIPIVIASNKCDLSADKWETKRQQIDEFMLNETMDCHAAELETSAKTGHNVWAVFETFVRLSPLLAASPLSKKFPTNTMNNSSSSLLNGGGGSTNNHTNGSTPAATARSNSSTGTSGGHPTTSPRRRQKPAPTIRRFSLQAFTLTGGSSGTSSSGAANTGTASGKTTPPPGSPTPYMESTARKGSTSPAFGLGSRRMRRNKTKSHEELDIPECFVQ